MDRERAFNDYHYREGSLRKQTNQLECLHKNEGYIANAKEIRSVMDAIYVPPSIDPHQRLNHWLLRAALRLFAFSSALRSLS